MGRALTEKRVLSGLPETPIHKPELSPKRRKVCHRAEEFLTCNSVRTPGSNKKFMTTRTEILPYISHVSISDSKLSAKNFMVDGILVLH